MVWLRPATQAPRGLPSPRRGAEENGKKEAETGGLRYGRFNRTANKRNSNNNNTDKDKTQHKPQKPQSCSPKQLPLHAPKPRVSSRRPASHHWNPA